MNFLFEEQEPAQRHIKWTRCFRLAMPEEDAIAGPPSDTISRIINYTSPRHRVSAGELPPGLGGSGARGVLGRAIGPAFFSLGESRFSDGSFGVCYVSNCERTAVLEAGARLEHLIGVSMRPFMSIELELFEMRVEGLFHDVTGGGYSRLMLRRSLEHSQAMGRTLRAAGSNGIIFPGPCMENPQAQCLAVFSAPTLKGSRSLGRIELGWRDGKLKGYWEKGTARRLCD